MYPYVLNVYNVPAYQQVRTSKLLLDFIQEFLGRFCRIILL